MTEPAETVVTAPAQQPERPRDLYRRYLMMEVGSYETALSTWGELPLTKWKLQTAKKLLDFLDWLEAQEILKAAAKSRGRK